MVVFSGANPKDQDLAKTKFVLVRHKKCEDFVTHQLNKNVAYKTTVKNEELLNELNTKDENVLEDFVEDEGIEGNLINMAFDDTDRVSDGILGCSTSVELSSGLFHFSKADVKIPTTVEEVKCNSKSVLKHLRVVNSNYHIEETDPHYYGSAFPHLFSYGIGTPNCERPVQVSLEEGIKHLLLLSDRKFGKDDVFVLASLDRLARTKSIGRMYIKLKSNASCAADAVEATKDEMIALLHHNKIAKKALRSGRMCPQIPNNLMSASRVLRSVESVASYSYGTEEERLKMKGIVHGDTQVSLDGCQYLFNIVMFIMVDMNLLTGIRSTIVNGYSDT